jgi:hypothetical protein
LGMYFDAVAVEVEKSLFFFRLALAILCASTPSPPKNQSNRVQVECREQMTGGKSVSFSL